MIKFDHVAVNVREVRGSVEWYKAALEATVLYQDETWALLLVGGAKIALTIPHQHPAHIAFDVGATPSEDFFASAKVHRDGTISKYVVDPDGNAIEYIHYPREQG
jgi:catechol-2,3-dioxygenase